MLTSDFRRKVHANFQNCIYVCNIFFFLHTDVKSSSISRKIEVHIKSNFQFCVSIDHFNATKNTIIVGVNNTTTHKLFDSCEKTVPHFMTSL